MHVNDSSKGARRGKERMNNGDTDDNKHKDQDDKGYTMVTKKKFNKQGTQQGMPQNHQETTPQKVQQNGTRKGGEKEAKIREE